MRPAHPAGLFDRGYERVRGRPYDEADGDRAEQVFDELPEPLRSLDPLHTQPEVIVRGEEEITDQDGLNDEQPREGAAHQYDAETLRIGIDLFSEPVARERKRQQRGDRDEIAHVAHPVIVDALLPGLGAEVFVRAVRRGDGPTKCDVRDHAVHVNRHPDIVLNRARQTHKLAGVGDAARRVHEREPGVRDKHDCRAGNVQQNPERDVDFRRKLAPPVVVAIEKQRLQEEEAHVRKEGPAEYRDQVIG